MTTAQTHPTDMASLHLAVQNTAAFWTALARTRGHDLVRRPGFLSVGGGERAGQRILLLSPAPAADDLAALTELARRRSLGKVTIEDPFSSLDLGELGVTPRQLPVMIRRPGPVPAPSAMKVTRVEREDQLETAEHLVVHGFPLTGLQPYRPGEAFPKDLLNHQGVELFLIDRDGRPAGACVAISDSTTGGLYWVTTLPEHRSHGVGRALMHAVLGHLKDLPITLTAAKAGKPLYDSLGFDTVTHATWWS